MKLLFLHDFPVVWSLIIIIGVLLITIVASLLKNRSERAKAGKAQNP